MAESDEQFQCLMTDLEKSNRDEAKSYRKKKILGGGKGRSCIQVKSEMNGKIMEVVRSQMS